MDNQVDERDYSLLERDRYTFFVMRRIIGAECSLLLTDHERLIICYTGAPYPVWIWTLDDARAEEYENAYRISRENGLLDGEHTFNIKYELADYFIKRAADDDLSLKITMNMFAYDCMNPILPESKVDGNIHRCTEKDIDDLVDFLELFHEEVEIDKKSNAEYRQDAENCAKTGRLYFWVNDQGKKIASCQYAPTGDMASLNFVYTQKAYRRKHYAENLVYQVTKIARDAGYTPMLYTNADYVASNACYEKIGYVLRGKLCTIG
ncbi:MAG: GNAT family N-acetyltransferase [Lachnospiraceae bacterium]|nr:GNAT family N-acetyltransferase [Lachnospiraceae bacterium]